MSELNPTELKGIAKRWRADGYTLLINPEWILEQDWKDARTLADAHLAHLAAAEAEAAEGPRWVDRPTGPGLWICEGDEASDRMGMSHFLAMSLDDESLQRGAPFYTTRVYGPIPIEAKKGGA